MEKLSPSLKTFDSLFERTCTELSKALCYYYPIEGDNDISEATTMMYWGCALRDAGYFIYPQIQYGGNTSQHMEMAAINPDSKTIMIVEAKRLYSSEKAKSLGDDWVRLQNLKLPSEWDPIPEGLCSWACLIGTVWSEKNQHREWWMCGNREAAPQGVRKKSDWKDLKNALDQASIVSAREIPLKTKQFSQKVFLLLAIIEMERNCWR